MRHARGQHFYGVLAAAARAAIFFLARRNAPRRHEAWRPVALYWRQQRKVLERIRASRVALAAGVVWFPQFHLHYLIHVNERPWRGSMLRWLPDAAIYPRRVLMDYQRTTVKSSMIVAQPHRDQHPVNVFSIRRTRSGSDTSVQAPVTYTDSARQAIAALVRRPVHVFSLRNARSGSGTRVHAPAPDASSARKPVVPPAKTWVTNRAQRPVRIFSFRHVRSDSGTSVQAAALYASSARQPITLPTATWSAEHAHYPNPGHTHSRYHLSSGTDAQEQPLQMLRTFKREPLVFRPRSPLMSNAVPPYLQENTAPQPSFHPQNLAWRRNERQADSRELGHQSLVRSFPGQEVASVMPHSSGHVPTAPAIKIDSGLMDRLTDEVIRRVERRARIERARRGL